MSIKRLQESFCTAAEARPGDLHQPLMRQNPIEQALFGEYLYCIFIPQASVALGVLAALLLLED